MAALIPDGTYNIQNVQFPGSVINLSGGLPYAAINGWPSGGSTNLQWIVKNIGDNQITLENVTARGYYLTVDYFFRAAPAFGSPNPTYWVVKEVTNGAYTLEAKSLLLELQRGSELATIWIEKPRPPPGKEQQWTFVPLNK